MEAYTERWKDAFQRPLEMVQFPGVVHCADVKAGAEIVPDSLAPSEQRVISQTADFEMAELSISSSGDIDAMEVDCLGTTPSTPTNTAPAIADYTHLAVHRTFCQKCHNGSNTIPEIGHTKKTRNPGAIVWSTCLKCTVAAHWVCLAAKQKANVDTATGSFICSACCHGGVCIVCLGTVPASPPTVHSHATMPSNPPALVFRCLACRRPAHYACVPTVPGLPPFTSATSIAAFYQKGFCADCTTYCYDVDKILAWRAYPPNAVQPSSKDNHPPNDKDPLNREYLVKWQDRSHRRLQWVPHMWFHVQQGTVTKLRNFLRGQVTKAVFREDPSHAPAEQRDAMEAIPVAWKTPERVLRLLLWRHPSSSPPGSRADSDRFATQRALTQKLGWNPSGEFTMNLDEWEKFKKRTFTLNDLDEVAWAYIKWEGLNYDQASWDSPPLPDEPGYRAFQTALARFLKSLGGIPIKSRSKELPEHSGVWTTTPSDLQLGQDSTLKLIDYQFAGVSWLRQHWRNRHHCILADDMGLGKTVQIVVFLGSIAESSNAAPSLVIVPNATLSNWGREFAKWAPKLNVVTFFGNTTSRDIIVDHELFHSKTPRTPKFDVLLTTFEGATDSTNWPVLRSCHWNVMVVDEAQRLKGDSPALRGSLESLQSDHRVLMTGTPLNNNVTELFNLMNFLDPGKWADLEAIASNCQTLSHNQVLEMHNKLRAYFLRRTKTQVLELPAKVETTIPVSMSAFQKTIYTQIQARNLDPNGRLMEGRKDVKHVVLNLRQCLQHPFVYDDTLEEHGLSATTEHTNLVRTSGKLQVLQVMLARLLTLGRRVLLFTQYIKVLNIIDDFLVCEGYRFLRLDGDTPNEQRQPGLDEFNKPNSDIFIYILTTHAGGVGINLYTADTVIIFDPDYNPHQDTQAIARAYRYGQLNTCLVFKLVVPNSVEDRIMHIREKKIRLDELIIQSMEHPEETEADLKAMLLDYNTEQSLDGMPSRDTPYTAPEIARIIDRSIAEANTP
ncbi:SNF2 family N-terminal domain-containing protein [Mycena polygramma]|nr:SNF2 family N-terminal domain-containing protein [Mycena polygramma]